MSLPVSFTKPSDACKHLDFRYKKVVDSGKRFKEVIKYRAANVAFVADTC